MPKGEIFPVTDLRYFSTLFIYYTQINFVWIECGLYVLMKLEQILPRACPEQNLIILDDLNLSELDLQVNCRYEEKPFLKIRANSNQFWIEVKRIRGK